MLPVQEGVGRGRYHSNLRAFVNRHSEHTATTGRYLQLKLLHKRIWIRAVSTGYAEPTAATKAHAPCHPRLYFSAAPRSGTLLTHDDNDDKFA